METQDPRREEFVRLVREHSRSMFRAAQVPCWTATRRPRTRWGRRCCWPGSPTLVCGTRRGKRLAARTRQLRLRPAAEDRPGGGTDGRRSGLPRSGTRERSYLWDAVRALPEDQRLAVLLYYYEDMPVAEIARTLGIAQGTVKSRLSRGRDRLRQMLREEEQYGNQRT